MKSVGSGHLEVRHYEFYFIGIHMRALGSAISIYIYIYPGPEGPHGSMPHPPPPLSTYLIQNLLAPFTSKFGLHREVVEVCGVRGRGGG